MYDTHCTILNEIGQYAYFASSNICFKSADPSSNPTRSNKIFKFFFLHNFRTGTLHIMHTGCPIRNCGLVFILCIFRQLWAETMGPDSTCGHLTAARPLNRRAPQCELPGVWAGSAWANFHFNFSLNFP